MARDSQKINQTKTRVFGVYRGCARLLIAVTFICVAGIALWPRLSIADEVRPPAARSPLPGFVRVLDGHFVLDGKPFVLSGINYFGSWRGTTTIDAGPDQRFGTIWAIYHDYSSADIDQDFRFLRTELNATAVRIGTPTAADFTSLVQYHNYKPWYNPDGTITDEYARRLVRLSEAALHNGIRIQFCLLWGLGHEVESDPDAFRLGGEKDLFYSRQVRSIAAVLREHPGVLSYSIGNEVLVAWKINGTHRSWFEPLAAGFIRRRIRDLRDTAPAQMITSDEGATPDAKQWYSPGPEFALLPDVDGSNGGKAYRLVDELDYVGAHFYPEHINAADLAQPDAKIEDAARQLAHYFRETRDAGKPIVFDEFGMPIDPPTLAPDRYGPIRDQLYARVLGDGQLLGLQGLLAWSALPTMVLRPGTYVIAPSHLNPFSPTEVDLNDDSLHPKRILFLDPSFDLFEWNATDDTPRPTAAARFLSEAWPTIPRPAGTQTRVDQRKE